ncbi:hypothetical protein [Flagellimonas lutaonensis]|uniref:Lipocalin-like domain-containing protein n=1 Tax=Flagellimonas lutaonensis TaxID=516051 RepID=A0A0D5YPR8_9FLAO|nr:hypothetical protein [Allomuricauda lutaonensis]AKA33873.1 hypothetical protein VC82_184 [Allomuricauda lutaonensis]
MRIVILLLSVSFLACEEDNSSEMPIGNSKIIGQWELEATRISPGDIVKEWTLVEDGEIYHFKSDGSFSRKNSSNDVSGNYGFDDDNQILTILPQENNQLRFNVQLKGDKMILGFIGCIEECSYRYRRRN